MLVCLIGLLIIYFDLFLWGFVFVFQWGFYFAFVLKKEKNLELGG